MPQCLIFKMGTCSSKNTSKIGVKTTNIEETTRGPEIIYLSSSDNACDAGSCSCIDDNNYTNVSCEDSDSGSYIEKVEKVYTSLDDLLLGSDSGMCQDSDCGSGYCIETVSYTHLTLPTIYSV